MIEGSKNLSSLAKSIKAREVVIFGKMARTTLQAQINSVFNKLAENVSNPNPNRGNQSKHFLQKSIFTLVSMTVDK